MESKTVESTQTVLPPLEKDILLSIEEFERHLNANTTLGSSIMAVRPMVANNVLCGIEELRRQLREKLADREKMVEVLMEYRESDASHKRCVTARTVVHGAPRDYRCDLCKLADTLLLEGK